MWTCICPFWRLHASRCDAKGDMGVVVYTASQALAKRRAGEGHPVYEQRRVDLATFRAVPASTWGHCPQVLCFTIVWDTPEKEKVAKWSSAPASILEGFNEIYAVYKPKKTL